MTITVTEEYLGVQEVGTHVGVPMYFVEVQTVTDGNALHKKEKDIIDRALDFKAKWLAIRAGKKGEDPYDQDLDTLVALAFANNIKTYIETTGNRGQQIYTDWICLRPKLDRAIDPFLKQIANEMVFEPKSPQEVDTIIREFYNPHVSIVLVIFEEQFPDIIEKIVGLRNVRIFFR